LEICRRVDKRLEQNFADESYLEIVDFFFEPSRENFFPFCRATDFIPTLGFFPR